jgi:hypothetical protein
VEASIKLCGTVGRLTVFFSTLACVWGIVASALGSISKHPHKQIINANITTNIKNSFFIDIPPFFMKYIIAVTAFLF